jgi:hypothetical protein
LLSEAGEKMKHEVSEANDRLFLFQPASWKSAIPIYRESNLLTPTKKGSLTVSCKDL